MPDADDFDVEYFRALLGGGGAAGKPKDKAEEQPAKPAAPAGAGPARAAAGKSSPKRAKAARGRSAGTKRPVTRRSRP